MATRRIQTNLTLDGEKQWRDQMSAINRELKTLRSELSLSSVEFRGQSNSIEALKAKQDLLQRQYEQQKIKMQAYREAVTNTEHAQKTYADALESIKRKIENAGISVEKLTDKTGNLTDEEKKLAEEYFSAEGNLRRNAKLHDEASAEYAKAAVELDKLSTALNKNERFLDEADKSSKGVAKSIDQFGKEVSDASDETSTFGDVLKANLASEAIISGIRRMADALKDVVKDSVEAAAEYQAQQSQFSQTFGSLEGEASEAIEGIADSTGILSSRMKSSATSVYAFCKSSGADSATAMSVMKDALNISADAAAYYDRSLEDTTETLQSFLKGNYANDAALGVSCTETTRNAAAMEEFGKKYNDLSEIQKQQTLLKMVKDAQTLSGAVGQAAREADGLENVLGNWNAVITEMKVKLGDPVLKQLTPIIQGTTNALEKLINKRITVKQFINELLGINDVTEKVRALLPMLASATTAWVAYKGAMGISSVIDAVSKGMKALKLATEAETAAQTALNVVMDANAFAIVATVVAGCVAGLMALNAVSKEAVAEADVLSESERQLVDAATETAEAFREQTAATQEAIDGTNSQMDYVKELAEELTGLADASGNVSEADQARAKFILGELNNALGTEYEMVNGQIQAYGELEDSIYGLLEAKQAEALLDAYYSDYQEAIKGKTEAYEALTLAAEDWIGQSDLVKQTEAELVEARKIAANEEGKYTSAMAVGAETRVLKLENELRAQKDALAEKQEIYQANSDAYDNMVTTINAYGDAWIATEQGNYDEAVSILNGESEEYARYADNVSESMRDVLTELELNMINAGIKAQETKANFDAGIKGFGQKQVDEANKAYKQAMAAYNKAYKDAYGVGADIGDGMTSGMESRRNGIIAKGADIVNSLISTIRRAADSHSPSRKMIRVFGDIWDGAIVGTEQKEAEVQAAAQQQIAGVFDAMGNEVGRIPTNLDLRTSISYGSQMSSASAGSMRMDANLIAELKAIHSVVEELKSMGIYLDNGRLVGGLAPDMNRALGKLQVAEERGC